MKPNKSQFVDDDDLDRDWIHTEVLGQGRKKTGIFSGILIGIVLVCVIALIYIGFRDMLGKSDLTNLENIDQLKQEQLQKDAALRAAEEAAVKAAEEAKKKAEDSIVTYTVKANDTLAMIGAEFNVPYMTIADANGLKEPFNLEVGQILKIPGVKKPATDDSVNSEETQVSVGEETTYTVKAGDTLADIGLTLDIDWQSIATLNNLPEPYALEVGQILKIPKK